MNILTQEMIKEISYLAQMTNIKMIIDKINTSLKTIEIFLNKKLMDNSFRRLEII